MKCPDCKWKKNREQEMSVMIGFDKIGFYDIYECSDPECGLTVDEFDYWKYYDVQKKDYIQRQHPFEVVEDVRKPMIPSPKVQPTKKDKSKDRNSKQGKKVKRSLFEDSSNKKEQKK